MPAPHDIASLALFVDEQLSLLRSDLDQRYRGAFLVFGEEAGALNAGAFEWSAGDGGVGSFILPFRCQLFALSLALTGATARAKVDIERDTVVETLYAVDLTATNEGFALFHKPLEFSEGSKLRFHTVSQANTVGPNTVIAFFRTD